MKVRMRGWCVAVAMTGVMAGAGGVAAEELVLATWGGPVGKALLQHYVEPFQKATGIKVQMIAGGSAANKQRVASEKARPQIDLVTMTTTDAIEAYEAGLTAALDFQSIPNLSQLVDIAVKKTKGGEIYGAGLWMISMGIAYRTDKLGWEPNSWNDLWRPELRRRVGLPSPKYSSAYFQALINTLEGGPSDDISKGLEKLKSLKGNFAFEFDGSTQIIQSMTQGEVWVAPLLDAQASRMTAQGVPVKFIVPKEGGTVDIDVIAQVKNNPNPSGAKKFINFVMAKLPAQGAANAIEARSVNKDAEIPPELKGKLLTQPEIDRAIAIDESAINRNKGKWLEQWQQQISPLLGG